MRRRSSSSSSPGRSRRGWLLIVLVFALALPGVTRRIYASDEIQFYAFLRSLSFDRDVSFENEYRHFFDSGVARNDLFHETFLERRSETGLRLNFGTIGSALLWSPFYAAADALVRVRRATGGADAADGYAPPYIAAVCYASAAYGLFALLLSWSLARRTLAEAGMADDRAVQAATWAVWLGTPLLFYMYVAPVMSHATSAFAVALVLWVWQRVRREWSAGGLVALGAAAALMAMVREQDAFVAIGPAIDLVWTLVATGRWRLLARAAAGAAAFALAYLPQAAAYLALNGRLGPAGVTSRKMDWSSPHALDVLVSSEHGFLLWTPLAVLALAGLVVLAWGAWAPARAVPGPREARGSVRAWVAGLVAIVAAQVYVTGAVESWTLAGAFGQRRFIGLTAVLVIGASALLARAPARPLRTFLAIAFALCAWWNLGLIVQFGAGWMDRQRLDLPRNAYNTFITVPRRAPEIAYRYLFARDSFYRPVPPAAASPPAR